MKMLRSNFDIVSNGDEASGLVQGRGTSQRNLEMSMVLCAEPASAL